MKTITDYQIFDHGVEHSQYFQGEGLCFSTYTDLATGCGSTAAEAMEDCLEQLAMADWDVEGIEKNDDIQEYCGTDYTDFTPCSFCEYSDTDNSEMCDSCEMYYYITIKVKGE